MWWNLCVFLSWTAGSGHSEKVNVSQLVHLTSADFHQKLHSGNIMFIYFELEGSPPPSLFLVELEKSAEALKDYAVLVGKVDCHREQVHSYCTDHRRAHTAFLFRGGKEFLGFDLDTVFDVDSIVSEVLFAVLRDEVKYVHTDADLLALEKSCRGMMDIVLGYVPSLGTAEHRSLMETAYVYGSKYQFILITGGPVLEQLGVDEASSVSQVWFLHCGHPRGVPMSTRCPSTLMRKPVSTLSLHTFLQLMDAPLLSEVYDDPSVVPPPAFPYHRMPQVFLFSRPATAHLDQDTASTLAWRLRGVALLMLVHRQSPAVKTPPQYNAAYRLPEQGPEVNYLTLHSLDELLQLFTGAERQDGEKEEEEEEEEEEDSHDERLDDEVSASVHEKRAEPPDMDSVSSLTSNNFRSVVAQNSLTVALFYLKWDAISLTVLSSFVQVAQRLADSEVDHVLMGVVDCGEWTDLCADVTVQPITAFPQILLLRPDAHPQQYRGMLGSEPLQRFIMMSLPAAPLLLSTEEEVSSFLQEAPHPGLLGPRLHRALGLFPTHAHPGLPAFTEAAESLRGDVLTGLLSPEMTVKWTADHHVDLPSVLVFPSWRPHVPSLLPVSSSAGALKADVRTFLVPPVPELTVETLPSLLSLGKALLLLFVGQEEDDVGRRQNQALLEEMRGMQRLGGQRMERYLPCWTHLGRTPAAGDVLGALLGAMPLLPALLLTHIPSSDEVYRFPPSKPIVASAVLQWLHSIDEGVEPPAGMLAEDRWLPAEEFYDFLKIMDEQERDSSWEEEQEVDVQEHLVAMETTGNQRPEGHSEL